MSATELLIQKTKDLSESEAEFLLHCIQAMRGPAPSAGELLKMPRAIRHRILSEQFSRAEALYKENPELIVDDAEGPMDYE